MVEDNAEKAKNLAGDDATNYVVFSLFKGQALNRRDHPAIALEELRQALPRVDKVNRRHQADFYYNTASYECRVGDLDNSLKHLERAIYLTDDYKVKARPDPDFENLRNDERLKERFIRLTDDVIA